jgi:2-polyprenyl-3-methyl-5-hydroxy-6-metoxy-1,4-benzoquinol methylase
LLQINSNYKFIEPVDEVARLINGKANLLYQKLLTLDIGNADIDEFGKHYFNNHHAGRRLIFSIKSSADIIYKAVKQYGRPINETSFMDYGAGLGTLFMLAGMVGFKKVYFNDYFPQWAGYAKLICTRLEIVIDDYISGDIETVITYGKDNHLQFDIIASRNVIEHIYNLTDFYNKLFRANLTTLCYATTTANYHNIAMRLKHYWHHYKVEKKEYREQRRKYITELVPGISSSDLKQLVKITRGRAFSDFTDAVTAYTSKKKVAAVELLGTNTCDCKTGVWAEHLITRDKYARIITAAGFEFSYTAGFWDTNYKYKIVNLITSILNSIIKKAGASGYRLAPFVNITAIKNNGKAC